MSADGASHPEPESTPTPEPESTTEPEPAAEPEAATEESQTTHWKFVSDAWSRFISSWQGLTAVFALLLMLWTAVLFIVGKRELHLVVWVKSNTLVYPLEGMGDHVLPLVYENDPVRSLAVLDVEISNFGSKLIGDQKELWELEMEVSDAEHLTVTGEPVRCPEIVVANVEPTSQPNIVRLELGAFEPDAKVNVQLMAVNFDPGAPRRLVARSTLVGLPREVVVASPLRRVQKLLRWPAFWSAFVVFMTVLLFVAYRDRKALAETGWWAGQLFLATLGAAFFAAIFAGGISEGVAWLVLRVS